jgi:putative phage-type endonuclease
MKPATLTQGTAEWFEARVGCLTASRMADAMDFLKNGTESEKRRKLKMDLLAERLMGRKVDTLQTAAMKWGIENEEAARAFYSGTKQVEVEVPGFIKHDSIEYFGCSPDGFIDDNLIEIKCPQANTHLSYLMEPEIFLKSYAYQMATQCLITGAKWCDGVSYHPHFPIKQRMMVIRYHPAKKMLEDVLMHATNFLHEVNLMHNQLTERMENNG